MNWQYHWSLLILWVWQSYQFLSMEGDQRVWLFGNRGPYSVVRYEMLIGGRRHSMSLRDIWLRQNCIDLTQLTKLSHFWNVHHTLPRARSFAMYACVGRPIHDHTSSYPGHSRQPAPCTAKFCRSLLRLGFERYYRYCITSINASSRKARQLVSIIGFVIGILISAEEVRGTC